MESLSEPGGKSDGTLWRDVRYRRWFTADTALQVGVSLRNVVLTLVAYALSGSLVLSGMLTTVTGVIRLVMATLGGTVIDRHPRRTLVLFNALFSAVVWGVVTALMTVGVLSFPVYAIALLAVSVVNGLLGSATDAMLRSIVPTRLYAKAQAANNGRDAVVDLIGGPAGGAVYAVQAWMPFLLSSVMYALAGVAMSRVKIDESSLRRSKATTGHVREFAADFVAGWSWFLSTRRLPALALMLMLQNFAGVGVGNAVELLLVSNGTSAFNLGLLNTFMCVAALAGSVIAGRLSSSIRVGSALVLSNAVILGALLLMTTFHGYWMLVALLCAATLTMPLLNSSLMGFVFSRTPVDMQGRVDTCLSVPASALAVLSGGIAGGVIERWGFTVMIVVLCVIEAVALAICLCHPAIRHIPAARDWETVEL